MKTKYFTPEEGEESILQQRLALIDEGSEPLVSPRHARLWRLCRRLNDSVLTISKGAQCDSLMAITPAADCSTSLSPGHRRLHLANITHSPRANGASLDLVEKPGNNSLDTQPHSRESFPAHKSNLYPPSPRPTSEDPAQACDFDPVTKDAIIQPLSYIMSARSRVAKSPLHKYTQDKASQSKIIDARSIPNLAEPEATVVCQITSFSAWEKSRLRRFGAVCIAHWKIAKLKEAVCIRLACNDEVRFT